MSADWRQAPILRGEHVRVEPLGRAYAADLAEAGADPEVWRWLPYGPPEDEAAMERIVEGLTGDAGVVPFVLVEPATGRAIGVSTYLDVAPEHRRLEIGHTWVGRPWWRTAVNTEAKLLLLGHAFDTLGALRVSLKTDHENLRSQAAIERLGAQREGVLRAHMVRGDGSRRDSVYYSVLREEWPAVRDGLRARLAAGAR
jgi:N-acetyltransferase